MLLRFLLSAAAALLTAFGATAQSGYLIRPITSAIKDAGVYHLATGTWTRGHVAGAWFDVYFDNSCRSAYYGGWPSTERVLDDGRIPSTTSPDNHNGPFLTYSYRGTNNTYEIGSFQIGYCTFAPQPTLEINFWECFSGCEDASAVTPLASFQLVNMPGSAIGLGCWTVSVDLTNSGLAFDMQADCDGVWDGIAAEDNFGWSWQHLTPSTGGTPGPFVAGDPLGYLNGGPASSGCDIGANTIFYNGPMANPGEGSGLSGLDMYERHAWTSPGWAYDGCWFYGGYAPGNPYASFHMVLRAGGDPPPLPGYAYCPGDGTGTPCPYLNNSSMAWPLGGCLWELSGAFPDGGILDAFGSPDHGIADLTLVALGVENNFGIFFAASNQTNGGNGNVLNDGLRCAGGGLIRLTAPTLAIGNMASHGPVELSDTWAAPGAIRRYQYWFRSPNGPGGTMANLTNGYEISWM